MTTSSSVMLITRTCLSQLTNELST